MQRQIYSDFRTFRDWHRQQDIVMSGSLYLPTLSSFQWDPSSLLAHRMKTLIAQNSISCTTASEDHSNSGVIDYLASWFQEAGFSCEIQPVAPGKANLIATALGHSDGTKGLILSGHTDTVPCDPELWASNPFELTLRNDRLYGLGTADMKSFFALILEALREFDISQFKAPLIIIATCDEETSMAGARAHTQLAKSPGRFALIGEPTGLRPARLHKGVMLERVIVQGESGHSSDPSLGHNALEAMHSVMGQLLEFRDSLKLIRQPLFPVPYPTLNLGCIHGGDNPNRICGSCELQFDLRPLPGMDMTELRAQIQHRLHPIAEQHEVTVVYEPVTAGIPPAETPADSPFVRTLEKLSGHSAEAVSFGTEAPFFRSAGLDTVILGAGNIEQAHQPDEYLGLERIGPMLTILKQLINHYCVQGHP